MMRIKIGKLEKDMAAAAPRPSAHAFEGPEFEGHEAVHLDPGEVVPDKAFFTSFKGLDKTLGFAMANMLSDEEVEYGDEGPQFEYVAQWCYIFADTARCLYVNMPGMENGEGDVFNIGTARFVSDTPQDEIDEMVRTGFTRLMELVERAKKSAAK